MKRLLTIFCIAVLCSKAFTAATEPVKALTIEDCYVLAKTKLPPCKTKRAYFKK